MRQFERDLTIIASAAGCAALLVVCVSLFLFIPQPLASSQSNAGALLYFTVLGGTQVISCFVMGFVFSKPSQFEGRFSRVDFWVGPAACLLLATASVLWINATNLTWLACVLVAVEGVCVTQLAASWFWYLCDNPRFIEPSCLFAPLLIAILAVALLMILPYAVRGFLVTAAWCVGSICGHYLHRGALEPDNLKSEFNGKDPWSKRIKAESTAMLAVNYLLLGFVAGYVASQLRKLEAASISSSVFALLLLMLPLLMLVCLLVDSSRGKKITPLVIARLLPGFALTALLLFPLAWGHALAEALCFSMLCAIGLAYVALGWVALARHVLYSNLSHLRVLGRTRMVDYSAVLVGALSGSLSASSVVTNPLLATAVGVGIGVVYALTSSICHYPNFPEGDEAHERETEAPPVRTQWRKRCTVVSQKFHLTNRQYDVLVLISEGRDAAHVAEALSISVSTVQTHIRNTYLKLGVHSRQELIDLIEQTRLEGED